MRVSLFATCLGDRFFARGAADAVRLLRSLGVTVDVPPRQTCCGQPAWNAGHPDPARRMARHTRDVFRGDGYVVLPSGSCTVMLRSVYPELLNGEGGAEGAEAGGTRPPATRGVQTEDPGVGDARTADLAAPDEPLPRRAFELCQFLVEVLGVSELGRGLEGRRLAYHHGCHALRELGQRDAPPALLRAAGAELVEWEAAEECCGFGGLFAVKAAPVSVAMADRKLDTLPPVDALVSADPGCLLHLGGRAARRGEGPPVMPLASALWEARNGSPEAGAGGASPAGDGGPAAGPGSGGPESPGQGSGRRSRRYGGHGGRHG